MGDFAVALFFMITGYLFWDKILKEGGRPDWIKLYIGRVFRIGPLYLVSAVWVLFCVLAITHFALQVSARQFVREAGSWLFPLGILQGSTSVNGYKDAWRLLAGVTSTIHFAWLFYFSLFFLAIFPRLSRRAGMLLPATLLVLCLARVAFKPQHFLLPPLVVTVVYFWFGRLPAAILRVWARYDVCGLPFSMVILASSFAYFRFEHPYSIFPLLCLAVVFFLVAAGNTLFGALTARPAIRLGDISYGIYLLQGIPLLTFAYFRHRAYLSTLAYTGLTISIGIALIGLATLAHLWVERPGVKLGANLARKYRRASRPPQSVQQAENEGRSATA